MSVHDRTDADRMPEVAGAFRTTDWSVVLRAGAGESTGAEAALATLCGTYWYPLYAFVRRQGYSAHDAQDLAQGFFVHLLEGDILAVVDRRKGKFRSFLLCSIKNFLANNWDRQHAVKRGGRCSFISWDEEIAETVYQRGAVAQLTPEQEFERSWAMVLLETVQKKLQNEYMTADKAALFASLEGCILGDTVEVSYGELGHQFGMSEGAIKMAALRLRKRYRELLRREIAQTVETDREVDEEIGNLLAALTS